jgi:hypothetical protein
MAAMLFLISEALPARGIMREGTVVCKNVPTDSSTVLFHRFLLSVVFVLVVHIRADY